MATVIAGRFDGMSRARRAIDALAAAGFAPDRIASVPVAHRDEGRHASTPGGAVDAGSDESTSEHNAGDGAVSGTLQGVGVGAVVGFIGFPALGPVAPLVGAAVGAYVGSLAGALDGADAAPAQIVAADAGSADDGGTHAKDRMLVAVAASSPREQEMATAVLHAHGVAALRSVEGHISGGQWLDYDHDRR